MYNTFKYSIGLIAAILNFWKTDSTANYYLWVTVYTIFQSISYCWEIYMDWGLLRTT